MRFVKRSLFTPSSPRGLVMTPPARERNRSPAVPPPPAGWNLARRRLALVAAATAALAGGLFLAHRWVQPWLDRRQGLDLAREGRFAEAEPRLQRTLLRQPDDLEVVKALALGQLGANQLAEAEVSLGRWCDLHPNDAEPFR